MQRGRRHIRGYGRALVSMQIKTEMTTCTFLFFLVRSFSICYCRSRGSLWRKASQHKRKTRVWGPVGSVVFEKHGWDNPAAINLFRNDKKASRCLFCSLTGAIIFCVWRGFREKLFKLNPSEFFQWNVFDRRCCFIFFVCFWCFFLRKRIKNG